MIFRPELVHKIAAAKKTQTRRPVHGDEPRSRYQTGKTYAVQPGRGKPAAFRILITDVRRELAGDITLADALAEGFRTTDDFKAYWVHLHDPAWVDRQNTLLADEADDVDRDATLHDRVLVRFADRHAYRPVWVLTFTLDTQDRPRFLGATSPLAASGKARLVSPRKRKPGRAKLPERPLTADQASGYVENAALGLPREPEPVSEAEQKWITERAGQTTEHWHLLEQGHRDQYLRLLSIEQRMAAAHRAAQNNRVTISREMHLVRTRLRQGAGNGSVIRLLERAETKAYRPAA